jgi:hypothetical protein
MVSQAEEARRDGYHNRQGFFSDFCRLALAHAANLPCQKDFKAVRERDE